ncbi:efflux RND transporter periplasmic adaptor subunit [Sphingobacterium sp. SGG-5]|uniref:efflux RND transporter periplasmic adaptor subunit n=1 Tax=Sphingobacterium sp. SGG-5 TaxID=2710881 RepID=UPI0013ECDF94|nr:efflux RND transporter periplasmic adaptor subunit [Sphingobacterium sp. SGG-5]NGM62832.1 efflux RND transporter periplasmic adaptor subunit [Sphingobacterium sp. SGG-5]
MTRRIVFFLSAIGVIIIGLVAYRLLENSKNRKLETARKERGAATVYATVAKGRPFSDYLSLTGAIEPNEVVELRSEISGIVETLNFTEGSEVSAGQVLLKINDSELRAQLGEANTRKSLTAENERRARLLLEKEAISQEEYDLAKAEYQTAQSQIQLIEAQLSKTVLKAPFSGTIGLRNISKGSYITPTTEIAQLVNTSKLKVDFSVPEKYATKVKTNTFIQVSIQGDSTVYEARIYAIEPKIESNTRTLRVRAIVDNAKHNLIPGLFVNINFPLETLENAILIPTEALIPIQNGKKVFILDSGRAREIVVESGARTNEDVLITKGLNIGDTVLTSGMMSLRDGSPIQVSLR